MKKSIFATPLILLLLAGCATLAEKSRMESFGRIAEAYEHALRMGDYTVAAKFIDPSVSGHRPDPQKMKNFKIVEYKITRIDVSENNLEITQDVELKYFRLNSNILRTVRHPQQWRFQQTGKIWLLQTGLPDLGP